jgi:hypothetical protein
LSTLLTGIARGFPKSFYAIVDRQPNPSRQKKKNKIKKSYVFVRLKGK